MKRVMIFVLVLAMVVAVGGMIASAAGQKNPEELRETLAGLDYEVYTMASQSYEGEDIAPDESMTLLYSPEGYVLASIYDSYFERSDTFIMQLVSGSPVTALKRGIEYYSFGGQTLTITDEDGWTAVFTPAGRSADRAEVDTLLQSLAYENGMDRVLVHTVVQAKAA